MITDDRDNINQNKIMITDENITIIDNKRKSEKNQKNLEKINNMNG